MKVARLHGVGDIRISTEPDPVPTADESLVRIRAVGLCGSDLHWFGQGGIGDAVIADPLVLGHELAGVVEGGPLDGQRVAVDPSISCGTCPQCWEGNRNLCRRVRFAGHGGTDGGLRELITWPTALLHPVPDTVSDADVAMLEPLGVALHAVDLGHVSIGDTVVVVGCGPIGLCMIQLARVAGAGRVVALEPLAHRRADAARLGADVVIDPGDPECHAALADATGDGAHVVLEIAGTDAAVELALAAARPGARVVLAGIPDEDSTTFPASLARRNGLSLVFCRRMKEMYHRTTPLVAAGRVDVTSIVTDTFGLADVAEAFRLAARRAGGKVIVDPGR
jgi:L-iditol 2-dehydrogenase